MEAGPISEPIVKLRGATDGCDFARNRHRPLSYRSTSFVRFSFGIGYLLKMGDTIHSLDGGNTRDHGGVQLSRLLTPIPSDP